MVPGLHDPQGQVSSDKQQFVRNPPSPALTFVAADLHPWLYDETTFSPTPAERFRIFGGIALTPNVGFVAGLGVEVIRGFTLEGGVASLLGNVLPSGARFNTPVSANTKPQTQRGFSEAPFLAIGYSFR